MVALMNFAMIAIHLPASTAHHHGAGVPAVSPAHESTVMGAATVLAVVEVTIAAVVLYYRTRARRPFEAGAEAHRLTA
jgi:acyl dehydratase